MDVRLPDGTVIENVPEGTTKAQLVQKLAAKGYDVSWYKPESKVEERKPQYAAEAEKMSVIDQFFAGMGGAVKGMELGARQILPFVNAPSEEEVSEYQKSMQGLRGTGGGLTGEIAANILPGAAAMRGATMIPRVAGMMSGGGAAAAKTIAGLGGGIGAMEGALIPVTNEQSRAANIGIQGTLGAVAPAVTGVITKFGRGIKDMVKPALSNEAARVTAGKLMRDTAGSQADAVQQALARKGQIISPQTAGQRIVDEGIDATETLNLIQRAGKMYPDIGEKTLSAQKAARAGTLESFAKTPEALKAAEDARGAAFRSAISDAEEEFTKRRLIAETAIRPQQVKRVAELDAFRMIKGFKETPVRLPSTTPELDALSKNPGMKAAIADARRIAGDRRSLPEALTGMSNAVRNDVIKDPTKSLQGLELIKYAIDEGFKKDAKSLATTVSKIDDSTLSTLKKTFLGVVDNLSPEYAAARKAYEEASKDITEMKIGQEALDILRTPIGTKERGAMLAGRVDDEIALLKQAGGFTRKELSEQLKPENLTKLQNVIKELEIDKTFAEKAATGAGGKKVAEAISGMEGLPHFLNNAVVLINNFLRLSSGIGKDRTLKELATMVQDPQTLAAMMAKASTKEKNALKFLVNAQKAGAIVGPAVMETAE